MKKNQSSRKVYLFTSLSLLVALLLPLYLSFNKRCELMKVIEAIENMEMNFYDLHLNRRPPRVAIGFGICTDYIARAIDTLNYLNISAPNIGEFNENAFLLNDLSDLGQEFAQYFNLGAAAERYVHNPELFEIIKEAVSSLPLTKITIGGSATMMGNRLALEGAVVLLGAKVSPILSKFLHPNVTAVAIMEDESSDAHILLEYDIKEKWGPFITPRANRYIVHRDEQSPFLAGLEELREQISHFKPDVFLLGGLQMMDGFPYKEGLMKKQIDKIESFVQAIPADYPIHFEMASFLDQSLLSMLKKQIIPYSDSLGFNEQELPNLLSILANDSVTSVSTAFPRTSQMLDQMRRVWELLVDDVSYLKVKRNRLSRLHLHTIGYQIIMTNKKSKFWHSSRLSVAKASLIAHRHTCGNNNVDIEKSKLLMDDSFSISGGISNSPRVHFNFSDPVSCWEEREVEVCISPVLVCTKVIRTGGGGDNISSAGLLTQLRVHD